MSAPAPLRSVLATLRKAGDEAQWTQVIGAAAVSDPRFASELASALMSECPRSAAVRTLGPVPAELECRTEVTLRSATGRELGRVDLLFTDVERTFTVLAELKLHSAYRLDQLPDYLEALDALPGARKALLAVTKVDPLTGEELVRGDPRWLGSVRWYRAFDALRSLEHSDEVVARLWTGLLDLMREQGDFGPMDVKDDVLAAWARRDEAEKVIRDFLTDLAQPTLEMLRRALGEGPDDEHAAFRMAKGSQPIVPWKNQMHIKFAIPTAATEERFRIQFLALDGIPYFTVEARYQHPKEEIAGIPEIAAATDMLNLAGFRHGSDGWGHYWAHVRPADEMLAGAATLDRLLDAVDESVARLAESGIFPALAALTPTTPETPSPPAEE